MQRYIDADKFINELLRVYKGSMIDTVISPLGLENWVNERARAVPSAEKLREYHPAKEDLAKWNEQINELHAKGDLDATIKELAVICSCYEENRMDHLQTDCYKRALNFLVAFQELLNE